MRNLENDNPLLAIGSSGGGTPIGGEQAETSISDVFRILLKRKWLILLSVLLCGGLAAAYIAWKTPVYEATAAIQIDPSRMGSLGLSDLLSAASGGDADQLQTDLEILKSNSVALAALASLPLPQQREFAGPKFDLTALTNPDRMNPAQRDALTSKLHNSLKCKRVEGTQIVQVSVRDTDPRLATALANQIVDAYVKGTFQSRYNSVSQVSSWLSEQMNDLKGRATSAQRKLSDFQEKNNIIVNSTDVSNNTTIDRLKLLNDQLTQAEAERITKEARYRVAASGNPQLLASLAPDTTLDMLQSQQVQVFSQYAQLSSKFGAGYPPLADLKAQMTKLDAQIAEEIKTVSGRLQQEYQAAAQSEGMLRAQYEAQTHKAFALNGKIAEYALLKDEGEANRDLYNMLQYKLQQAGVDAGLGSVNTTIVDRAAIPSVAAEPQKTITLAIGLCLGLVTGIASAFLLEAGENNVESIDQIEALLGLPTLALVPQFNKRELAMPTNDGTKSLPDAANSNAVTVRRPLSRASEAYRTLRNSVLLSSLDRPMKTIAFTSSIPGEGKSTTAVNFAIVLAQKGAKVLLVDADLRRPSLSFILNVHSPHGLSSMLLDNDPAATHCNPIASLPDLKFIPSGPKIAAPSEVLSSSRFRKLLEKWETEYDFVILDSAPVLGVSDSIPMASWADSVLVVARYGTTPIKALLRTRNILARANAKIQGVILNGAEATGEDYYYGSYSEGYYA